MFDEYFLGIDVGTSSLKCTIIDSAGNSILSCASNYTFDTDQFGKSQQDPEVWYHALLTVLKDIENNYSFNLSNVACVSTTGQMRGVTLVDGSLNPVRKSIQWNDTLDYLETEIILQHAKYEHYKALNCNMVNTMCTLPKLLWVRRHEPEVWERMRFFMYPKDYIRLKLTGVVATEHTDASGSFLYDMYKSTWSDEILEEFEIDKSILPPLYSSFDTVGNITDKAASETGLLPGVPVVAGGSDATVEFYSMGQKFINSCKIRLGSSSSICALMKWEDWDNSLRHYCWKYVKDNYIELDINTSACALSIKWLRDVFFSELAKDSHSFTIIDQEAASVEAGAQGLFYHPYINGETAPYWNPSLSGCFSGMRISHDRRHFAKAVYEGVSFSLYHVMSEFPQVYSDCDSIVLMGGGSKANEWVKTLVNILGKPAIVDKTADAAYGAAVIALESSGYNASEAVHHLKMIEYSPKENELYKKLFKRYRFIADSLHDDSFNR